MAGPGAGKSTFAANLFSEMKRLGYKVELVSEFAKDCVYENRLNVLKNDQLFVIANQNRRIQRIADSSEGIDFVITDSPLLLSKVYADLYHYPKNFISFSDFCIDLFCSYDNINIFLKRLDDVDFEENGRIQNAEESIELDIAILNELKTWKIPYITLTSRKIDKEFFKKINILN